MLSEDDYAALRKVSAQRGEPIERLVHEAIAAHYAAGAPAKQIGSYQYPTGEMDTPEEEAEDKHLALSVGPGKPLSEIVIEDRGPC